ncbi:MAG: alkaline phosphatase D family protein [Cyclobacteriaceae bacterium]
MRKLSLFLLSSAILLGCKTSSQKQSIAAKNQAVPVDTTQTLTTIAFGSCNKTTEPQPLWTEIIQQKPDLWVWLGDNIYGDTSNMDAMREEYERQLQQPEYQRVITQVPVVGIWDDHDYGINDGGKNFAQKAPSRDLMLEFLNVDKNLPVWNREGGYQAYTFGPAEQQVKVILLDTRYFRDTLVKSNTEDRRYELNLEGDLLGNEQWNWLQNELQSSEAQINIIGSSIQVIAEDHGFEKWANFPQSRQRLLDLIAESEAQGVVLLSGDRHIGEISQLELADVPYPLLDITSSGLTHVYEEADEENRHRISNLVASLNYGLIQIDWQQQPPQVTYQIKGENGATYASETVSYSR